MTWVSIETRAFHDPRLTVAGRAKPEDVRAALLGARLVMEHDAQTLDLKPLRALFGDSGHEEGE
jgi:hypothetical protein